MRLKSVSNKRRFISRFNHFSKHWLTLGISIFLSCSLNAQVFIKQNPAGSGDGSSWNNAAGASDLQNAIELGGTDYVAAGNYTFSQTVRLEENVSITGGYPANASGTDLSGYDPATNATILDGDGANVSNKSAFEVVGEFDATNVTIRGIQFQNWKGTSGSVFGAWSRVINPVNYTFDECSFINNIGNVGVINLSNLGHPQNQVYITNCNFANNVGYNSSNLAGAIYLNAVYRQFNTFQPVTGNLVISDNSFTGNTAQTGGAIWTNQAFGWNISNNCFSNNLAISTGGACSFSNMSSTIFNGNQFFSNFVSGGDGGAMWAQTVNFIEFNDNIFTNNSAWTYGGALRLIGASLQGTNNEYSGNTSGLVSPVYNGGAIQHTHAYNSTVVSNLTSSVFFNNSPDDVQLNIISMFNLGPGNQFDPVGFTPTPAVTCSAPFILSPDSCTVNNTNVGLYEAFATVNTSSTNADLYGFTSLSTTPTLLSSNLTPGFDVNHLATDFTRDRVLFAGNEGLQDLFAYDFATNSVINIGPGFLSSLGQSTGGGSFYAGDYYLFDDNGFSSGEVGLYRITFDANGNAATLTEIAEVGISTSTATTIPVGQGDIAIDTDGTLYALESNQPGTGANTELWSLDLNATTPTWTLIGTPGLPGTSQIFIANDGRLIANNGAGDFVELSKTTGQVIDNTFDTSGSNTFWSDISEGGQVISCSDTVDCTINPSMIVSADTICPHDIISVSSTNLGSGATYNWSFGSMASPSTASGIGPHQVSYNACGIDTIFLFVNTDSCALRDTMLINIIDNTAPGFTVPPDQTVYFDAACTIDYSPLVTGEVTDETDNCASNLDATYTDDLSGLTACNGTGVIIRTWSLMDSCSNTSTQTQQITLRDTIAPAWTTSPADITIECDGTADPGGAISAWLAANGGGTAADACGAVTFTHDYTGLTSSTCTGAGSATVMFTATDNCGNFSTRSGVLTISDTTAPTLTPVADITVDCNNIPAPVAPIAADLCDPDVSLVYQEVSIQHPDPNWKSYGSCSLLYTVSNVFFDDKGTAGTADDEVTFTLTVIGQNTGTSWSANVNGTTITGNYYQTYEFGPILSNGSFLNFTIMDTNDPSCTVDVSI